MSQQPPQTMIVQRAPTNGAGTAGFVLSLVGWVTCGLLCPIGLLLSFIGLFKEPRGLAIAGFVLGLIGSIVPIAVVGIVGMGTIAGALGVMEATRISQEQELMTKAMREARDGIQAWFREHEGTLPDALDAEAAIEIELVGGEFADWNVIYERVAPDEYVLTIDRSDEELVIEMSWTFDADTGAAINKYLHTDNSD